MTTRGSRPTGGGSDLLLLSGQIGHPVRAHDGRLIGHLADVTTELDRQSGPLVVERLLVRRGRAADLLLPWAAVDVFGTAMIRVRGGIDDGAYRVSAIHDELGTDEILLVRDVLDTQIIDVVGQRLARVADVLLVRTGAERLELAGVEVGFGAVLRRLGVPGFDARRGRDVVAWNDLHLTSERGHAVQLATARSAVHHLDASRLAALLDRLDTESAAEVLAVRPPRAAAAAVSTTDPAVGERVLRAMPADAAARIVAAMPVEHSKHWRARLSRRPAMLGRRFIRSRVWPRR